MDERNMTPNRPAGHDVVELAGLLAPDAIVTETSHPTPALEHWNVAVIVDDASVAREAVLALESLSYDDAAVGFTVLSPTFAADETTEERAEAVHGAAGGVGADRERVISEIAPRTIVSGVIGAVVSAVVFGAAGWLVADGVGAIAGAVGGVLLGAPIAAIWGGFTRMGGSDAYRQTFVDPDDPSRFMVSLHTAALERAESASVQLDELGNVVRTEFDGDHLRIV